MKLPRASGRGLLVHLAATWFMAGVVWYVQIVHYPLLASVGHSLLPAYELRNRELTFWVVGPAMLIEGASGLWLVICRPRGIPRWQPLVGFGLLVLVWLSTFLVQLPLHRALSSQPDPDLLQQLVTSNWIRTAGWSLRGFLVLSMVYRVISERPLAMPNHSAAPGLMDSHSISGPT